MIVHYIELLKKTPPIMKKLLLYVMGISLIVWSLAAVDTSHAHTWLEKNIPGFWAIFGFISCVVFILFACWFGKSGIQVEEDYYDK